MEEVDSIILHFLRRLDVNIGDRIRTLSELPVEIIIEAATKCLVEINHSLKLPMKLPTGISHRIEIASQIASICKDLGYKNDVGYQTFLYYNEAELRQIFMFLIENLPNEGKQNVPKTSSNTTRSLLLQQISNKINEEINSVWIPPCCTMSTKCDNIFGDFIPKSVNRKRDFNIKMIIREDDIIKKINKIKNNACCGEGVLSSVNMAELHVDSSKTNIETNKSLKELKELSIVLRQKLDTLESERNVMDVEYSQAQKSCEKVEAEMKNVLGIMESIGISEVENESVENVTEIVESNISRLHKINEELTLKSLSLKVDLDRIKQQMNSSESERSKCKRILTVLKEDAKSMKEEYEKNEETRNQLKKVYEISKGGNKRSIYTKRILEIISNVDKQNMQIKKILEDTREIQKEINKIEGQLDRCFSVADETLFRDAKKDDQAKKAYKLLALLHSECSTIVSLVNDTGSIARDIVDLEDNIKTEKAKRTEDTLKKIHLDLSTMQQESNSSIFI